MNLKISSERLGPWSLVKLNGELDMATAGLLRDELSGRLNDGVKDLAVDLSNLTFIDSSGLSVMVFGLRLATAKGGSLVLVAPGSQAMRVFDASGLLKTFTFYARPDHLPGRPAAGQG